MLVRLPRSFPPGMEGSKMGRILAQVRVANGVDPQFKLEFTGLVDTGAYMLTVPTTWKPRFGPLPVSRREQFKAPYLDLKVAQPVMG